MFVHKGRTRIGYRTGDVVYDLTAAEREELVDGLGTFQNGSLNDFLALGPPQWTVVAQQAAQLPDRLAVPLDETEPAMPLYSAIWCCHTTWPVAALNRKRFPPQSGT